MNYKILGNRRKVRQNELAVLSRCVVDKMENNPVFPDPPAALAQLKKIIPEYQLSLAHATGRDKEMVAVKDNNKDIIHNLLDELAAYVTEICKGDRSLLLSSGFDITEEGAAGSPPSIKKLEVILGEPGEVTIRIKNATGAVAFIFEYTTEPPGPNTIWKSIGSSLRSYTIKGLTSDKRYWFRGIAIGRGELLAYSPVVTRVIQ
ncbi:hypothetical protein A4D02_15795 [Niastella koreensis]|uniref:Fibronectin type-III domain-containing protein n=2 Tax=Niastella koreensis TaxID=354356 RepID=G8TPJ2_NIAKG|nr:fibronectin type III domain-containing protein [Niastella koreensis]AEV97813.1 hypothetical protein Niako_1442 [Niastella koreensis GR20-10]OQP40377.1 hypothetical protein A4D02_15795 [Niastella koreensis]